MKCLFALVEDTPLLNCNKIFERAQEKAQHYGMSIVGSTFFIESG